MIRCLLSALVLLFPAAGGAADKPTTLKLWPGYSIELPAGHCVQLDRGPDFDVLYFRDEAAPKSPILLGLYTGHNPEEPKCENGKTKEWNANGLAFLSVRGTDGCAEFAVRDPKKPERGSMHLWFGPAAKERNSLAEAAISSIRPIPFVERPDDLPKCK